MKELAYVSGPYRAATLEAVHTNIELARQIAKALWKMGYVVICPHSNTAFFDGIVADNVWLEGDLLILSRCDLVVGIPGWTLSEGAQKEIAHANSSLIPVFYWPEDIKELQRRAEATKTMKFNCPGPFQDDTGISYCPYRPSDDEYDCDACRAEHERSEELAADAGRDEWG